MNAYNDIQEPEHDDVVELAHEIWALSNLVPGEGITDAVDRIVPLLLQLKQSTLPHCASS